MSDVYVYTHASDTRPHVHRTEEAVPGKVMLDYDASDRLLGVEILGAGEVRVDGNPVPPPEPRTEADLARSLGRPGRGDQ